MRHLRDMIAVAALVVAPLSQPRAEDAGAMALALAAADAGDWVTARDAAVASGPMAEALIGWQALRAGHGDFNDYLGFVRAHPDWPGLQQLRTLGDAKLRPDLPAEDITEWLAGRQPYDLVTQTAWLATLDDGAANDARAAFWSEASLSAAQEATLLAEHGPDLAPLHSVRAAALLDRREWGQAERLLPLIPEADRPLIQARITLQAGRAGVDDLILALPPDQRADPGLTLDRFLWRVQAKQHDGARALMLEASADPATLRAPVLWGPMRVDYTRQALRNGDWELAEQLAANHHLPETDSRVADLEWLAGYAALRDGAPDRALARFRHLKSLVGSKISLSRAYYWQGRAHRALGDEGAAQAAFARGAEMPGTYYGQLSAEITGKRMPASYAVTGSALETLPDWRGSALRENGVFRAALWLVATGRKNEAQRFLIHLAETAAPEDIARMSRLMYEVGMPWHGLRLSKQAASKGVIYPAAHFPLTGLEKTELGLPPELVLAIARQESEFNHTVSSHAGARGLMQVMPGTAEDMARKIREPYELARLTVDAAYNARLGAAYLDGLRDRFGTSIALVASGYNAGPGRPARWLNDFGDLRRDADPVDWVEMIPFDETRNYVMRVTEALPVYRARILGKPAPIVPTWDLTGGGLMPPPVARLTLALSARPVPKPFIGPPIPESLLPVEIEAAAAIQ